MNTRQAFMLGLVLGTLYLSTIVLCMACYQLNKENDALGLELAQVKRLSVVKERYQRVPVEDQPAKSPE